MATALFPSNPSSLPALSSTISIKFSSQSSCSNSSFRLSPPRAAVPSIRKKFTRQKQFKCRSAKSTIQSGMDDKLHYLEENEEDCELVNGFDIMLGEAEDGYNAYLLKAVKNNNGAAVLLLSDEYGYEDPETRDFSYRLSCNGYNVLVPDLFGGAPWSKSESNSEFETWRRKQSPQMMKRVIDLCTNWLVDEFTTAGMTEKLGIIGFSFGGGQLLETLATDTNCHYGAAVCFYGTGITPTSVAQIKVPVLFIAGDVDPTCNIEVLQNAKKQIMESEVHVYAGRGHGFVHRPNTSEEDEDAENAFLETRNWLSKNLLTVSDDSDATN